VLQLPQPPDLPVGFRGSLYVSAALGPRDDSPTALWRLPLQGKPVLLHTFRANRGIELTPLGDRLLFRADSGDGYGIELWQTDGTPAGTTRVTDLNPGEGSSSPGGFIVAGERVFFSARDGEHGDEPWESDGTAAGTRRVQDINPGPFASMPYGLVSGSNFFFAADDGVTGLEPWVLPLEQGTP
jgi:ELWxxDGT repeat protein